ncbi:MAG: zinc ribbon domain-containing protein [Lachnospiraceae bacterium]|nr:zinc ribbon domain-containing protein [Lachnospiraceae bacterium]
MAGLKETLEKGIATLNVKTNNFVEESKCKSHIAALEKEITNLKLSIGNIVFENWNNDGDTLNGVEELLQKIGEKEQEIVTHKERIKQLSEEKQVFGVDDGQAAVSENVVYCSQCGASNALNYKFCFKCGTPLKD